VSGVSVRPIIVVFLLQLTKRVLSESDTLTSCWCSTVRYAFRFTYILINM